MEAARWWRENPLIRDAVLPAALLLLIVVAGGPDVDRLFSVLLVLPLFWRRTQPEIVLLVSVVLSLAQLLVVQSPSIGNVAAPLVVHAATAYAKEQWWGWAALTAGLGGAVIGTVVWFQYRLVSTDVFIVGALAVVSVVGAFMIGKREVSHADESRAASEERSRLLEQDRGRQLEMAAATERARIARELHDIVAHSLSVVVVQADGGRAAAKANPAIAPEVLETIAGTARTALQDMRRLVGVLRSGAGAESGHPDYAPAPTAADIPELVDQVRGTGRDVQLLVSGTERTLPAGIGLTVYRLVQESLTNVIKHAGPTATAEVSLNYTADGVQVSVLDDGRGAAAFSDGMGNGLTGMRERVGLQGGTVAAHPRAGGGFLVTASLPTPGPTGDHAGRGDRPAPPTSHQERTR